MRLIEKISRGGTAPKIAASLVFVGAAATIAGLASYATFTDTVTASQALGSGTVKITLGPINRLTVGATQLAAGDTVQRQIQVSNTAPGDLDWSSINLTTTATVSSALDTDATNGLRMDIDKCSVAWTEGGTAPAYTYTCSGSTTNLISNVPVIGANRALTGLSSMTVGGTDYLRVKLTLPSTAPSALQGKASTIQYQFDAVPARRHGQVATAVAGHPSGHPHPQDVR